MKKINDIIKEMKALGDKGFEFLVKKYQNENAGTKVIGGSVDMTGGDWLFGYLVVQKTEVSVKGNLNYFYNIEVKKVSSFYTKLNKDNHANPNADLFFYKEEAAKYADSGKIERF